MASELFSKLSKRIDSYKDEMIELQKKLIAIPAIGPECGGEGEAKKAEMLKPFLTEVFDSVEEFNAPDDRVPAGYRPNLVARMKGKDPSRIIWLLAHMDVVPAGDESAWKTPPFEAVVKDGKIYGRGAEDNHQGIVSSFFAVKALKDEGIVPEHNVGMVLVADEEAGDLEYGVKYLVRNHGNIFGKKDLFIVPDHGNVKGTEIEVAEKSMIWIKIKIQGKSSHAAWPQKGINAHRASAHLVCRIDRLYTIFDEHNEIFDPPTSTFEPTLKEANVDNINTIPGEDVIFYDCRILPSTSPKVVIKEFEKTFREIEDQFGVRITHEITYYSESPTPTSNDSDIVKMIKRGSNELFNTDPKPIGVGGNTVAGPIRGIGIDVAVFAKLDEKLHEPNEYCLIQNMIDETKIWAHIFLQK